MNQDYSLTRVTERPVPTCFRAGSGCLASAVPVCLCARGGVWSPSNPPRFVRVCVLYWMARHGQNGSQAALNNDVQAFPLRGLLDHLPLPKLSDLRILPNFTATPDVDMRIPKDLYRAGLQSHRGTLEWPAIFTSEK